MAKKRMLDRVPIWKDRGIRALFRLVWPSLLLQCARGRVATAAAMERDVRKTA